MAGVPFVLLEPHDAVAFLFGLFDGSTNMTQVETRRALFVVMTMFALICGAPYLIFNVPLIGPSLLGVEPTGYDQAGNVRPQMTLSEMNEKWDLEEQAQAQSRGPNLHQIAYVHRHKATVRKRAQEAIKGVSLV